MLASFLLTTWTNYDAEQLGLGEIELYVAHGEECHRLSVTDGLVTVSHVPDLSCDHEEADTCMILHANHASASYIIG